MSRAWHGIGRYTYAVTVAGGTGYVDGNFTGRLGTLIVTKTGTAPTVSWIITDINAKPVAGGEPKTGNEINYPVEDRPCYGKNRITLNSDVDGAYEVTIYGLVQGGDWLVSSPT